MNANVSPGTWVQCVMLVGDQRGLIKLNEIYCIYDICPQEVLDIEDTSILWPDAAVGYAFTDKTTWISETEPYYFCSVLFKPIYKVDDEAVQKYYDEEPQEIKDLFRVTVPERVEESA